jgi:hypothetical protein
MIFLGHDRHFRSLFFVVEDVLLKWSVKMFVWERNRDSYSPSLYPCCAFAHGENVDKSDSPLDLESPLPVHNNRAVLNFLDPSTE